MLRRRKPARGASKPFVSVEELARLTPLSKATIYTMISRGTFKRGVHFHKLGRRTVFDWEAVVALIRDGGKPSARSATRIPLTRGGFLGEPKEK